MMVPFVDPSEQVLGYVNITPTLAAQWLERNTFNRPVKAYVVQKYARDMTMGQWVGSVDAIAFSRDGVLLNGQHRLQAIVASGVNVRMLVVYNMENSDQHLIDSGKPRKYGDKLHLRGESYSALLGAIVRRTFLFACGYVDNRGQETAAVSDATLDTFFELHADEFRDAARFVSQFKAKYGSIVRSGGVLGMTYMIFSRIDKVKTTEFFDVLGTGYGLHAGHPIATLLKYLRRPGRKAADGDIIEWFVRSWNAFLRGDSLSVFKQTAQPYRIDRFDPACLLSSTIASVYQRRATRNKGNVNPVAQRTSRGDSVPEELNPFMY